MAAPVLPKTGTGGLTRRRSRAAAALSARAAPYRALAAAAAGTALVAAVDPTHTHVPLCPLHAATGLWCPFCGSLRAVHALTKSDLRTAVQDNLLLVLSLPALAALWLCWVARVRAGRPRRAWPRAVVLGLVAVAAAYFVLRNLPFAGALRPSG
jgi:Protein of unknown function (DUF2752)